MRKSIFKSEMEAAFQVFKVSDKDSMKVLKALFENPFDITKQYLLKEDLKSIPQIAGLLKELVDEEELISDISSLFQIDDDLELPSTLREQLERKEKIAIVVGAGVSKLLGVPIWSELSEKAIWYLYKKDFLNFAEAKQIISENISPKQKLSIFHEILPKESEYAKEFYKDIFKKDNKEKRNPYDDLVLLDIPKITLNIDHHFWDAFERKYIKDGQVGFKPIHSYEEFKANIPIVNNCIYQIHGSYRNLSSYSIITMRDYLFYYFRDTNLKEFLRKFFIEHSAIFIGCGMEEFEILQEVIKSERHHHVLLPIYLNDINLLRFRKNYFKKSLGIIVHGYYLDFNGYDRLLSVIESWVKKIRFEQNAGFYEKTIGEFNGIKL